MADFNIKSKRDEEIESLAMNLRRNKLASSDSEARRMAEEMLRTSKKVQEDFVEREKRMYGGQASKDPEIELAHKQVEQLASNLAQGKTNVRIDIPEIDVNKPLKEIVGDDPDYEKEDDEEVMVKEEFQEEPVEEAGLEANEPEEEPVVGVVDEESVSIVSGEVADEAVRAEEDDSGNGDDDSDDGSEEESPGDAPIDDTEKEEASDECEGPIEGEPDFSVKEIDNNEQLRKSEEERKAEISRMEESKIDLSSVFNANK